jgi:hypothetical protein
MAAHALLAGLEVGTSRVKCNLGFKPPAQVTACADMMETGATIKKIEITRVKRARICLFHFDGMLETDAFRAYIAYADPNNKVIPANLTTIEPSYDIPNTFLTTLESTCAIHAPFVELLPLLQNFGGLH